MKTKLVGLVLVYIFSACSFANAQAIECVTLINNATMNASTNGNAVSIRGYTFMARLTGTNNSGTTPTLDVKLQHSPDCTTWKDLTGGVFTQQTTGGPTTQDLAILTTVTYVYGCIRAVTTLGGTTPNYNVNVQFCSDKL